jgi:hypothetical protein
LDGAHLVTIEQGDMFSVDLRPATVVTLFVTAEYNLLLMPQLGRLRPGSRVVSHWFGIPGHPADRTIAVPAEPGRSWPLAGDAGADQPHALHLWTAPLRRGTTNDSRQ